MEHFILIIFSRNPSPSGKFYVIPAPVLRTLACIEAGLQSMNDRTQTETDNEREGMTVDVIQLTSNTRKAPCDILTRLSAIERNADIVILSSNLESNQICS